MMHSEDLDRNSLTQEVKKARLLRKQSTRKMFLCFVVMVAVLSVAALIISIIRIDQRIPWISIDTRAIVEETRPFAFKYVTFHWIGWCLSAGFIVVYVWIALEGIGLMESVLRKNIIPIITKRFFRQSSPKGNLVHRKGIEWEIEVEARMRKSNFTILLLLSLLTMAIPAILSIFPTPPILPTKYYGPVILGASSIMYVLLSLHVVRNVIAAGKRAGIEETEAKGIIKCGAMPAIVLSIYAMAMVYGFHLPFFLARLSWRRLIFPQLIGVINSWIETSQTKGFDMPGSGVRELSNSFDMFMRNMDASKYLDIVLPVSFVYLLAAVVFVTLLPLFALCSIVPLAKRIIFTVVFIFSSTFFQWILVRVFRLHTNLWFTAGTTVVAYLLSYLAQRITESYRKKPTTPT